MARHSRFSSLGKYVYVRDSELDGEEIVEAHLGAA